MQTTKPKYTKNPLPEQPPCDSYKDGYPFRFYWNVDLVTPEELVYVDSRDPSRFYVAHFDVMNPRERIEAARECVITHFGNSYLEDFDVQHQDVIRHFALAACKAEPADVYA